MRYLAILSYMMLLIIEADSFGDYLKTDCIGNPTALVRFVYLHGWDHPSIGSHEKRNRKMFERLSKKYNWRVALPRGNGRCNRGRKQCWKVAGASQIKQSWKRVLDGAKTCFPEKSSFGLVGFSNGGFFSTGAYGLCLEPRPLWTLSFGSAGLGFQHPSSFRSCGPLRLFVGSREGIRARTELLYKRLKPYVKDINLIIYEGWHDVDESSLVKEIRVLEHH